MELILSIEIRMIPSTRRASLLMLGPSNQLRKSNQLDGRLLEESAALSQSARLVCKWLVRNVVRAFRLMEEMRSCKALTRATVVVKMERHLPEKRDNISAKRHGHKPDRSPGHQQQQRPPVHMVLVGERSQRLAGHDGVCPIGPSRSGFGPTT
jgi:hypothetical protein